ncbi:SDR family oxidoreductase [Paenibacillus psychroresistens]|uniref:SDR family oxidoreductase n=1 Tax=Paenibacillus psychroresistens TaxID=1778678 RepID=A0A6B8RNB1_9BACL|nr:SDR family oxidoreductase [Paenibacillus psychroresistens]QGQ97254.1 SDR family oxidoreductase [Paenibacillus psychroresistens]
MKHQPLLEKVAIITGSSRGIGRSIALLLASQGAKVVINYSADQEAADKVVQEIESEGGTAIVIRADISKVADIEQLFNQTIATYGKIDILVNNAGVMATKPIDQVTEEDFDRQFAINVKGTYFAIQQAVKHMGVDGRIINFSTSVVGYMFPTYSVYAGTKGAVEQFTRQLAKELGPRGITINTVAPGPVNTELFTTGKSEALINQLASTNSFNRLGEPEDISSVVAFLASNDSRWISGQTIRINGGSV